jgi:hypothetical protein
MSLNTSSPMPSPTSRGNLRPGAEQQQLVERLRNFFRQFKFLWSIVQWIYAYVSKTDAPTLEPFNIAVAGDGLREMLNKPEFIRQINTGLQANVPHSIDINAKATAAAPEQCTKETFAGCLCYLSYDVGAELQTCSGLNSIELVEWQLDSLSATMGGDLSAAMVAELRVDGSCTGKADTKGAACGVPVAASGTLTASVAVDRIVGRVSAKVVRGTGSDKGKMCLQVDNVHGDVGKDDIRWTGINIDVEGLPLDVPSSVANTLWTSLPLDGVFDGFRNQAFGVLEAQLQKAAKCF